MCSCVHSETTWLPGFAQSLPSPRDLESQAAKRDGPSKGMFFWTWFACSESNILLGCLWRASAKIHSCQYILSQGVRPAWPGLLFSQQAHKQHAHGWAHKGYVQRVFEGPRHTPDPPFDVIWTQLASQTHNMAEFRFTLPSSKFTPKTPIMILFTRFDQWNSTTDPVLGANHYPPRCLAASNACNMFWNDTSPENALLPYLVKGVLLWTCFGSIQNDLLSFIINEKNYLNENKKG